MMYRFLQTFSLLLRKLISPKYLVYYVMMIVLTYLIVISGLDFWYFKFVSTFIPRYFLFGADIAGFIIPVVLPIFLFWQARKKKDKIIFITAKAITYTVMLGFTVSTLIKSFSGRQSPFFGHNQSMVDNSHNFNFGFLREQVVGGWPSSHATISIALAVTLITLYPNSLMIKIVSLPIAIFISVGVTFGFHWLSELVAGVLLGIVIGTVVGKHFFQVRSLKSKIKALR